MTESNTWVSLKLCNSRGLLVCVHECQRSESNVVTLSLVWRVCMMSSGYRSNTPRDPSLFISCLQWHTPLMGQQQSFIMDIPCWGLTVVWIYSLIMDDGNQMAAETILHRHNTPWVQRLNLNQRVWSLKHTAFWLLSMKTRKSAFLFRDQLSWILELLHQVWCSLCEILYLMSFKVWNMILSL